MFRRGKRRRRAADEKRLRKECEQLRFIATFAEIESWTDQAEIQSLLARVIAARSELSKVIYAHDDSSKRLVTAGIGTGALIVSLKGLPTGLGVVGVVASIGLIANDVVGLAKTKARLAADRRLETMLLGLSTRLRTRCADLGIDFRPPSTPEDEAP